MAWTYDTLKTAVQQWSEVDSDIFVANIPQFVQNAETVIYNAAQPPVVRKREVIEPVIVAGGIGRYPIAERTIAFGEPGQFSPAPYSDVELPSDLLAIYSIGVVVPSGQSQFLLQKEPEYIREAYATVREAAIPTHYAFTEPYQIIVGPTAKVIYPLTIDYLAYPPSIVTAGTSWVGTNYPNLLLYGTLVEAYIFLKGEDDLIKTYTGKFQEALGQYKQMADGKDRQDTFRSLQVRDEVR